uniref:RAS p21 protein activator 2 n=1 Tax=Denticeps clupeoides TaxID=299321 RepID=A0AAY4CR43_9TELE
FVYITFYLKCEAKHLGPSSGPTRPRDFSTFCTVNLDQEEVLRTQVCEKTLSPLYGEDFYFEIPRPFQCLSFYVYAKGVFQRDLPVGKVAIRKEDLSKLSGKENWFTLQSVDPNSEVQGKVHLEMKLNELITENGSVCHVCAVSRRIIACQGLPLISGQNCDPYATVMLVGPARSDQRKTKVKKKTSNPQFEETFFFEVEQTRLILSFFFFFMYVSLDFRYLLQPKGNGNKPKPEDLGSLRLNITYTEDIVLPSACYHCLRALVLQSPDVKPISASAAHILAEVCKEQYEAVLPVVKLLLHHNRLVPFVSSIAELELEQTQEANTIFRGNSLATRCIDDMMKIVGRSYLAVTLKPVLDEICESNKTCEIDPVKLKDGDNKEINKENLQCFVQKVFSSITQSSASCPPLMCDVFRSLRQMASRRFPADPHVQYSAVSSFVFLRFFAVAVLSPHTFQLRPHHPDPEVTRTLTLISKTIQTLGSWGSLSKNKLVGSTLLTECFAFDIITRACISTVVKKKKKGLVMAFCVRAQVMTFAPSVHSEVQKRAQGRKRIGKRNFKKRWLRVTTQELSYHKQKGKEPLCVIPVKDILGVEKLEESAFKRKNMFQVIQSEKPLYVQAGNCVEVCEWIEVLSQVSRCNPGRLSVFHPSAFLMGAWQCCKAQNEGQPGCRPCSTATLANIQQLDIDCDRETEKIFTLFSSSHSNLQKMEDACASLSVYLGQQKEQEEYSAFTIQDPMETFQTPRFILSALTDGRRFLPKISQYMSPIHPFLIIRPVPSAEKLPQSIIFPSHALQWVWCSWDAYFP